MKSDTETLTDSFPDIYRYVGLGRKRMSVALNRFALGIGHVPTLQDPEHALARLSPGSQILVLCHGNICRSPLAERLFRTRFEERGRDDIDVVSAGFVEREDRPSPDAAVEAAAEFGIDLSDHQSTHVTESLLTSSDLVLLMDAYNYTLFRRHYGDELHRACFLGVFTERDEYEISDPYDASLAEFERVYDEIATAITEFVDRIEDEDG